jgi:hypothetical protein
MEAAIFVALFVAVFLPVVFAGAKSNAEEERGRARRMAEHRMNARLLRFNLDVSLKAPR